MPASRNNKHGGLHYLPLAAFPRTSTVKPARSTITLSAGLKGVRELIHEVDLCQKGMPHVSKLSGVATVTRTRIAEVTRGPHLWLRDFEDTAAVLKPVREKTAVPRYDRLCSHTSLRESVQMQPETRSDAKVRATSTYNAAADYFDAPALSFWDRIGQRTVERMSLKVGACVLDACCGSGASAIPAAKAIGPSGRLLGVDLAEV